MNKTLTLLLSSLSLLLFSCNADHAGKVDETDTSIAGLVSPVGAPVENATVRIQHFRDTSNYQIDSLTTDSNGKYDIGFLENGTYTIWAESEKYVLFRDSITISENSIYNKIDTMDAPRKVQIPVKLQEQDMDRVEKVYSHILGTHIYPVVNKDGLLTLEGIPNSTFPLRLYVHEKNFEYTPQTFDITIDKSSPDTLSDTLELSYTGVPIVTGINATYDTLTGDVNIWWNSDTSVSVKKYEVYREPTDFSSPKVLAGGTADTLFKENLKGSELAAGEYEYRVRIVTQNEDTGIGFHSAYIDYVDPVIELNTIQQHSITANFNENLTVPLHISEWYGDSPTVTYNLGNDSAKEVNSSSLSISIESYYTDSLPLVVTIFSKDKVPVSDTTYINISHNWYEYGTSPIREGTYLKPVLFNDIVIVPVHLNNSVTLYESRDSCKTWTELSSNVLTSYDTSMVSNPIVFNNKLWMVSGNGILHSSEDGRLWASESYQKYNTEWRFSESTTYSIDTIQGAIHLAIDNYGDPKSIGTDTYFLTYNETTGAFEANLQKYKVSKKVFHYWLTPGNRTFDCFVFHDFSTDRSIDRYSVINDSIVFTNTIIQNSTDSQYRTNRPALLSSVQYAEGVLLADGAGENRLLYMGSDNSTIAFNDHPNMSEPANLFVLGKTLFSINSDGVYANKKSSN